MTGDKTSENTIENNEKTVEIIGNQLQNRLKKALFEFNQSIRNYLKRELVVDGKEDIVDNLYFHIGVIENTDEKGLAGKARTPFALICGKTVNEVECKEMLPKDIRQLWKDIFSWGEREVQVEQTEVDNSIENDHVNRCTLIIAGTINKEKVAIREKILLKMVLDLLCEIINDLKGIIDIHELLRKIEREGTVDFMGRYVKTVFQRYHNVPLFSSEECKRLSYEKYEERNCHAIVYIGEEREKIEEKVKKLEKREKMIFFRMDNSHVEITDRTSEDLEEGRIRYIRKMMEACKEDNRLLTSFDQKKDIVLYGIINKERLDILGYKMYLQFDGYGTWSLYENDEEILFYTKGQYYYSRSAKKNLYGKQLEKKANRSEEEIAVFKEIIDCLSNQPHGTGMIIADDIKEEAKRLCYLKRGIFIEEGLDLKVAENRELLLGITSVDGVLMVDWNGLCYAFGVILDGKAQRAGNPARGARYNSLKDYILEKTGRYMVVVSEDGRKVTIE